DISVVVTGRYYLPLRYVAALLGLLGCAVDYLVKFSISVTLVDMVNITTTPNIIFNPCPAALDADDNNDATMSNGEYSWTPLQRTAVLTTFLWGYSITKIV
ncbi:Vesicular glutamate transporter 3-like 1, partial [Homarus americanus]